MVFAVWACAGARRPRARRSSRTRSSRPSGRRAPSPRCSRTRRWSATATRPGFLARYFEKLRYRFGPRERAGLFTFLELARDVGELDRVPDLRFVRRATCVAEHGERRRVADPREGARGRADLPTTRRSRCSSRRDLVAVGKAADELRGRRTDSGRITFIIDRNVNYTNVCVTDCDFCAFYRRPGDRAEGYLLPKTVIYKKIEETLAIGGTGVLMQGGHHPDLGDRLLRGPLPLDQGALPDPPARALAARDPAHRAPLEAERPGHADPAARRRPRLDPRRRRRDPRRPRPRHHRAEEDEDRRLARTSCATRTASACRRRRR